MSSFNRGTAGTICHPKERLFEQFVWKLERFSSLSAVVGHRYHSPIFKFAGSSWFLELYTNGEVSSPGNIALYLVLKEMDSPKHIHYMLGIKMGTGNIELWGNYISTFDERDSGYGIKGAFKRSELLRRKSTFVPSDCLNIMVIMSKNVCKPLGVLSDEDINAKNISQESQLPEKRGCEKALEDIGKLLISGENSDVMIKVGDIEFKAHIAILAARSPVLSAMFQHDTAEKASNEITIEDCEPDIFKEFLHYIYTGTVQDFTAQNVFALYEVADKYLINDLKLQCLTYIQDTLSIETFCNAVKIALTYREDKLLELVTEFAISNIRLIILSEEWQKFIQQHSLQANEILIKSLGPP